VAIRGSTVEALGLNRSFWKGRRVFVTGHTGFKGGWLTLWLKHLGARVSGFALCPPTHPSLFEAAGIAYCLEQHTTGDVRDPVALQSAVAAADPEVIFHLAAQPLVRDSYSAPVDTYATNVLGTAHLLESIRGRDAALAVVNVTTDKCYDNREWVWGYRESEPLGGRDPYSSSKACSELVTAAYRASYFESGHTGIATARAGNVIGGGDWAKDRLLPDFFRALDARSVLEVRYPGAVRPWQHVLEPLSGYLLLAQKLASGDRAFSAAWNFGPDHEDCMTVAQILEHLQNRTDGDRWRPSSATSPHEARVLRLDSAMARSELGWRPRWRIGTALDRTLEWHRRWSMRADVQQVCFDQIEAYAAS
jgi:CDP-glucose 4,6-dehydratase